MFSWLQHRTAFKLDTELKFCKVKLAKNLFVFEFLSLTFLKDQRNGEFCGNLWGKKHVC